MKNQPQNDTQQDDNSIVALRQMLFDSMRALKPGAKPEEIELAKARSEVAQTIINSVKVEVEFTKATGLQSGSGFIPIAAPQGAQKPALQNLREKGILPEEPARPGITTPAPGVTVHRLRG